MPEIFVSYSQRDKPIARHIAVQLQERGGSLRSHSLERCTHLLLIHSPRAAASSRVAAEVAAGLRAGLPLIVAVVAELAAEDLPITLDPNATVVRLTRPDEAPDALNELAALFDLPDADAALPDAGAFAPVEPDADAAPDPDPAIRDDLFFAAAERLGSSPGVALFLLRALLRAAPEYADGALAALFEVKYESWREAAVDDLAKRIAAAGSAQQLEEAQQIAEWLTTLAPQHPRTLEALERLRGMRLDALSEAAEALAAATSWGSPEVAALVEQMRALNPDDERVRRADDQAQRARVAEALYALAQRAAQAGEVHAFAALMGELGIFAPDFGDPRRLMHENPIQADFIALLRATDVLRDHTGAVRALAYSPDGALLVSGGADATLRLWDMTETPRRVAVLRVPERAIRTVRFSRDGLAMVTTGASRFVRVWSMPEGREAILLDQFDSDVTCAIFTPDGAALICGYTNGQVEALDLQSGRVLARLEGHKASINDLALAGDALLTISDDGMLKAWLISSEGLPYSPARHTHEAHTMLINALAVSADRRYAVTVSNDERSVMWRVNDGGMQWDTHLGVQLRAAAFAPFGPLLACGGADGSLHLINAERGQHIRRLAVHERAINALAFAPDGVTLASGSSDNSIRLWRLGS